MTALGGAPWLAADQADEGADDAIELGNDGGIQRRDVSQSTSDLEAGEGLAGGAESGMVAGRAVLSAGKHALRQLVRLHTKADREKSGA